MEDGNANLTGPVFLDLDCNVFSPIVIEIALEVRRIETIDDRVPVIEMLRAKIIPNLLGYSDEGIFDQLALTGKCPCACKQKHRQEDQNPPGYLVPRARTSHRLISG